MWNGTFSRVVFFIVSTLLTRFSKMVVHYRIQLAVVRLDRFICCRIKEHAGNLVGLVHELCILVLDIGENLIQICRMQCMNIVVRLSRMRVILGVDDKPRASGEHDIALHYRQHRPDTIIPSPRDPRSHRCHLRTLLGIVFEDEFLVQMIHVLFIHKGGLLVFFRVYGQKHSFQNELTETDKHTIGIIVSLEPNG